MEKKQKPVGIKKEVIRKSIHIGGFLVIPISMTIGLAYTALFIVSLTVAYSISEYARLRGRGLPFFASVTRTAMREGIGHESKSFVRAPVYFAAGILFALLVFPAPSSYAAVAVVTLGDGVASLVGRSIGRVRLPHTGGKTLEGTVTGILCAFLGASLFVSPSTAAAAAIAGMAVELSPLPISDNLSVPVVSGLTALLLSNNF